MERDKFQAPNQNWESWHSYRPPPPDQQGAPHYPHPAQGYYAFPARADGTPQSMPQPQGRVYGFPVYGDAVLGRPIDASTAGRSVRQAEPIPRPPPAGTEEGESTAMGGTFRVAKIPWLDAELRVHWLFLLILVLLPLALGIPGCNGQKECGLRFLFFFVLYGPILFGTVLLHELGHAVAAKLRGGHCHNIYLWPLGGLAMLGGHGLSAKDNAIIAVAGPLVHAPLFLFWYALFKGTTDGEGLMLTAPVEESFWRNLTVYAMVVQIVLAAFNLLLPIYPMDGGQLWASLLIMCGVGANSAAIAIVIVSSALLAALAIFALLSFQFLLMAVSFFLFIQVYHLESMRRRRLLFLHPIFAPAFQRDEQSESINAA